MNQELTKFMMDFRPKLKPTERLMLARVAGSRSYNLHDEASDYDFNGIFIASNASLLGLEAHADNYCHKDGATVNYAFYEIGKFIRLCLKGNPAILEMLWADHNNRDSQWMEAGFRLLYWHELTNNKKEFVNRTTLKGYLGYINDQVKRLKKGEPLHTSGGLYNPKWAYHILRLSFDATMVMAGNVPIIFRPENTVEYNLLRKVRVGCFTKNEVRDMIDSQMKFIESKRPWSYLPEAASFEFCNDFLLRCRGLKENPLDGGPW